MARKYSTQLGKSNSSALCNLLRKNSLSGNIRAVSTFFQSRNFENVPNTIPSWTGTELWGKRNFKIQRVKLKIYACWCWSLWILFYNYTLKYLYILPFFPLYKLDKYLSSCLSRKYWCCENQPWKQDFSLPFCPFICNKNF